MELTNHLLHRIERETAGAPAPLLRRHIEQIRAGRAAASYEVRVHAAALLLKLEGRLRSESAEAVHPPTQPDYLAPWMDLPSVDDLSLRSDFPIPPADAHSGRMDDFGMRR
ncbi:hypothetical protein OU995_07570 [Roseateles sp. SL47]|uniref:hypothetical protein n=1 Tax=Roseateles sp. SL47 TaxID=2995138 RepID=UPI00226F0EDA|nr:hypothetical protein [Roseateles sp. SL47]WAC74555.1 hypothetical protein OU995_07570 [Roseateles sp. SL47]